MPYIPDKIIDITCREVSKYIISSQHRRTGNPHKSVWLISFDEEVNCFIQTLNENWRIEKYAWGIQFSSGSLQELGQNSNMKMLKLAKFVIDEKLGAWHGYPADYISRAQDRPTTNILKSWVEKGYLSKAKMSKIRQGQLCNL